jgi:Bacteriophage lambda head decoration protein D
MPGNDSVEFDYTPGYVKPTHEYGTPFGDEFHAEAVEELLLSMAGYTQRGVTLAAGQGVLPTGCIIARHTASGKYFAYNPSATDGRQTALGVLRDARDTGGPGAASLAAYNANTNGVNPDGITLAGAGSAVFPASPAGKVAVDGLGNMVVRGILNANVVSGADTTSLIPNTNGLGSGAGQAMAQLGARYASWGGPVGSAAFPGGPMDGNPPGGPTGTNAFIF